MYISALYPFVGYCSSQTTTKDGERVSTVQAFLRPAMDRRNLHIGLYCHVTKVSLMACDFHSKVCFEQKSEKLFVTSGNSSGHLVLSHSGLAFVLMLRPFFPELVMSTDLLSFEHPSVLLFCWVAIVTPADRPKSVRNRCVIEVFGGVLCVVTLLFGFFCRCKGFCHRAESDLFLFT